MARELSLRERDHPLIRPPPHRPCGELRKALTRRRLEASPSGGDDGAYRNTPGPGALRSLDLVAAVLAGGECTASEAATTETITVSADEGLPSAARLLTEHRVSHLAVVEGASGYPVAVLSSIDIAAVLAELAG